jgi:glycosyltransferase involved in cell wall biosynthesis
MTAKTKSSRPLRIGIVVPHIFMHRDILPYVIFSPGELAVTLAEGLERENVSVTLFSPGPINTSLRNITADLSYFERELKGRGDTYMDLLRKHPFTFLTLARQVQSELIASAYAMANRGELDIVHIYTNEEDIALPFAELCTKPVIFTHHDPFNFLVKYKNTFPKFKDLNWVSMSLAQRKSMPADTNWVGNVYHGLPDETLTPIDSPADDYVLFLGRIVQPKGLHVAIDAIQRYNRTAETSLKLIIAGKHYAGHKKDTYWQERILPELKDPNIEFVGFKVGEDKHQLLANARALLLPSLFDEPFGMVSIESLACGTPVVGLDSGATPEIITNGKTGFLVKKTYESDGEVDEAATAQALAEAIQNVPCIIREACRSAFEDRFTMQRMCDEHLAIYDKLRA